MECKTLINIIDMFNDEAAIMSMLLKPCKIINIVNSTTNVEVANDLTHFLEEIIEDCTIENITFKVNEVTEIISILDKIITKDTIINVSDGNPLAILFIKELGVKKGAKIYYADIYEDIVYEVHENNIKEIYSLKGLDVDIDNFIALTGGEIVDEETGQLNIKKHNKYLEWILLEYKTWETVKKNIKNSNAIKHSKYGNYENILINKKMVRRNKEEIERWIEILDKLGFVKRHIESTNNYIITFRNKEDKYFTTSGRWLEHIVSRAVKEIEGITDLKTGVKYIWDRNRTRNAIYNEIDVMATYDNKLICISCKDTSSYKTSTINEIFVYGEHLGGEKSIKIIVATEKPRQTNIVYSRAEEVGVNIIIFNGDIKKLKNDIINTINGINVKK